MAYTASKAAFVSGRNYSPSPDPPVASSPPTLASPGSESSLSKKFSNALGFFSGESSASAHAEKTAAMEAHLGICAIVILSLADVCCATAKLRIIPVVVLENADDAQPLARALLAGGIGCMEITFRTAAAQRAIEEASKVKGMLVGAGD